MIVIVGIPAWRAAEPASPAGRACEIAVAAARSGARVELVGRTGDDPVGDALMLALAHEGVGHVAMLRDPARATPVVDPPPDDDDQPLRIDDAAGDGGDRPPPARAEGVPPATGPAAPRLEPADVSLGLQYLTTFGVLVVTDDVPAAVVPVAAEAAGYAGAHLVVLVSPDAEAPASLPAAATVLAAPREADEGAFGSMIAAYAVALDTGAAPADAFAAATGGVGWESIEA